jgi:hypothetical protein
MEDIIFVGGLRWLHCTLLGHNPPRFFFIIYCMVIATTLGIISPTLESTLISLTILFYLEVVMEFP